MTQSPNILHLRFNSPASGFAQNANLSQEIEAMRWLAGLFIHQSCSWQSKHDKPHRMMKGNYSPRNVENSLVSSVCHHLCAHVFEDPKIHVDRTELCLPWLVDLKHDYRFFLNVIGQSLHKQSRAPAKEPGCVGKPPGPIPVP